MSNALSRDVPIAERRGLTCEYRMTCDLLRNEKTIGKGEYSNERKTDNLRKR